LDIHVGEYRDLYDGPVFEKCKTNTDEYPGYFLRPKELARCPVECECAWARGIMDIVNHWEKQPA